MKIKHVFKYGSIGILILSFSLSGCAQRSNTNQFHETINTQQLSSTMETNGANETHQTSSQPEDQDATEKTVKMPPLNLKADLKPAVFGKIHKTSNTLGVTPSPTEFQINSYDALPQADHFKVLLDTAEMRDRLIENHFMVDGARGYNEFFQLYEHNRYYLVKSREAETEEGYPVIYETWLQGIPSVITPDVILHNFHLFFGYLLANVEMEFFLPTLTELTNSLYEYTKELYNNYKGTAYEAALEDNLVFLYIGKVILAETDEEETVSTEWRLDAIIWDDFLGEPLREKIRQEYQRVLEANTKAKPDIFDYPEVFREDYSQYKPRGHYTKHFNLKKYFKTMMWYGRILLSFKSEQAVRSALMLSLALHNAEHALVQWSSLFDPITFLVGNPDDITVYELTPLIEKHFGSHPTPENVLKQETFRAFMNDCAQLPPPQIQGIATMTETGPELADTLSYHLFSQRTVLDQVIFQQLVTPKVEGKMTITALELPAVLGNAEAQSLVNEKEFAMRQAYSTQFDTMVEKGPSLLDQEKDKTIFASWLNMIDPLLKIVDPGYPYFMQTDAYSYLRLNTYMASFAQLKHDTILYAKMGAAEMGGPEIIREDILLDDRGYVVPEVQVYYRIHQVLSKLKAGLESYQFFPPSLEESYTQFQQLTNQLVIMSKKILEGLPLSPEEYELIRFIGGDLEHFWDETLIAKDAYMDKTLALQANNSQMIADIFSMPSTVLEVATGFIHPIYVLFELDGKVRIGRGGVMSYYEFESEERLNDDQWREKLRDQNPQPHPEWTHHFLIPPETRVNYYFYSDEILNRG